MLKPTQTQPFQPESRSTSWEHTKLLWNSSSGVHAASGLAPGARLVRQQPTPGAS